MLYDLELLKKDFLEYKKQNTISHSQISYLKSLYGDYIKSSSDNISFEALLAKILKHEEHITLESITSHEVGIIIDAFNKQLLPLQKKQANRIGQHLNFQELSTILNKQVTKLSDINRKDYFRLVNNPIYNFSYCLSHFNLKCDDIIIKSDIDYEYGYQKTDKCINDKLYYIKFYNLLTLDYDNIELDEIINLLNTHFTDKDKVAFYIYKTYAGYHLYYMSTPLSHTDPITCHFMKSLKCDLWYILFSHKNGFKIRLSMKKGRDETDVETFVAKWGNGEIHDGCQQSIDILNQYLSTVSVHNEY